MDVQLAILVQFVKHVFLLQPFYRIKHVNVPQEVFLLQTQLVFANPVILIVQLAPLLGRA
jgi:hypothetical protein